ncbi:C2 domain-containing protein 3 [Geranomyces variabilis]|uniref:C2 domain-containing protein 3 n=1 Tax=Geranomyces variabilis TaxID=109894 RepID=A0AAD5XSL6_9FUNG|nr:C2 domain-containing protein 3 [Geranomyces variabilis]
MTLPSPSNLPTPSPVVSVPPKLAGNVNYFLHVIIARIAWSAPPTASKPLSTLNQARTGNPDTPPARSLSQTGARVRLTWWGEEGSGTIFQPLSSGLREPTKRVQPPTSSLPVPLVRARTWTRAGVSPQPTPNSSSHHLYASSNFSPEHQQSGKIAVAYPVRCYKTQLSKYFRDMGPLVLQVLVDGRIVGEVTVPDLAALVSGSPVNNFFPIYEKTDASLKSSKIGKRRKLGDLHLSIILESAVVGGSANVHRHVDTAKQYATPPATTARPQLQRHQTFGVNPSTPREPESESIARPETISDIKIASMIGTPQLRFTASYSHKSEDSHSDAGKLRSTGISPLLREADQLNETIADLPEPEDEVVSGTLQTEATDMNAPGDEERVESEPGQHKQMSSEGPAILKAVATGEVLSQPHTRVKATPAASSFRDKNEQLADLDISGNHVLSSDDEEDSDLLEDDVLIEALNSAKGRGLIDSNSRARNEHTYKSQNVDQSQYTDDLDVDDDDDEEDPDLSDDERKRRAVLDFARKQHRKRAARAAATAAAASQPSPRDSVLSIDKLTSLGRADSVKVTIGTLELLPDVVPHTPTALLATYSLPDAPGTSNVARSKSLPRLAVSRNASRRPVGALAGSLGAEPSSKDTTAPKYTTAFDHARVAPCTFDAALVDLWLKARIGFRITAEHRRAVGGRVPLAERIEEWALEGSFSCADVLSNANFECSVKIPLYRAAGKMMDAKPAARARVDTGAGAGRRASRPVVVGHLEVTIALLSGTVIRPRAELPGRASISRNPSPTRRDDINRAAANRFSSTSKPYYFHLTITTARSLAILPSLDATSSIMLYLVVRLFSASTPPIETPPVLFKSPFDLKTGRLNAPPDFGFAYTVPLAVTPEFLETHADTPLVAEVWIIDSENSTPPTSIASGPRMTRTEVKALDLVDRGAKLLGLVKLPFSHLLNTLAAGWDAQNAEREQEEAAPEDLPVMVPGAEYCILDPFTGSAKGWVNAFMALGTWDQIKKVRKPVVWAGQSEADDQPTTTAAAAASKPPAPRHHHKTVHGRRGKAATVACKMAVTIHNACGLRGLINAVLDSRVPSTSRAHGGQQRYTPLDYARDVGVNAYVRFTPFPASMYRGAADSEADDGYDSADGAGNRSRSPSPAHHAAGVQTRDAPEFETKILAQTFAPVWRHHTTLAVKDDNGDLMRWMRHGGEARGEMWHRVPRNIADDAGTDGEENSRDVLLGSFRVPLRDVVTKQKGLDRVWVPVVASRGDDDDQEARNDEVDAAVRVSIKLAEGFDFGVSHDYAPGGAAENWWCALTVAIGKVRAPAGHRHHPVHRNGDADEEGHSSRQLYMRWRHPRSSKSRGSLEESSDSRSDADDDWKVVTSQPIPAKRHQPRHGHHAAVLTADMKYRQTVDVEMTPSVMRGYHDHRMEIQVFRTSVDLEDVSPSRTTEVGVLVGAAYVDLSDAFSKAKVALRKRKDAGRNRSVDGEDVFVVEGSFPLIDPTSPDLCGARIQLRVDVSPLLAAPTVPKPPSSEFAAVTERQLPKPSSPPATMEAGNMTANTSVPPREDMQQHIPFEIAVEKAMKLPLIDDPLSGYMRSPFVPHDAPQLAPPNTFVTFEWSEDLAPESNESQKPPSPQSFSTDLVPSLRCPNWNYVVTVTYRKTEAALRALKAGRSIEFSVWHSPDLPGIGRGSGSKRRSQRRVDGDDHARRQLLGTATVDLGGLFGGLREIYGWYHVFDEQKASQGQLLLRVKPKMNLAVALRELTGEVAPDVARRSSTHSRRRRRLQDACGESLLVAGSSFSPPRHHQGPPPMAVAFPAAADGNDALFAAAASTAHAAAFLSRSPRELNTSTHSVDTWVWTGASWEHRHVDVLRASTDAIDTGDQEVQREARGNDTAVVHESSPRRNPSGVEASFRRSRGELDALTAQLRRRSAADSPVIPALVLRSPSPPSPPPPLPRSEHLGRDLFAREKSESEPSQPTTPRAASPIGNVRTKRVASPTPNRTVPLLNSDDGARDDAEQAAGELRVSHLGEPSPAERYNADAGVVEADPSPSPTPVPPVRDDSLEHEALPAHEAEPADDAGSQKRGPSPREQYRLDKALSVAAAAGATKDDVAEDDVEKVDLAAVGTASGRLDHVSATHISATVADDTWKRLEGRIEAIRADICQSQSRELEQELADNMSGVESDRDHEPSPAAIAPKRFDPYRDSSEDDEESDDSGDDPSPNRYKRDIGSNVKVGVPDARNTASDEQGSGADTDDEHRRRDLPPRAGTTRWRMRHPKQANKENLRLVPDVDAAAGCDDQQDDEDTADTTSDDEIYGILAYRRMAAATANPASSTSAVAARRAVARKATTRKQPYDPFGVRIPAASRAAWKTAPESSDTDGSESGRRGNVKTRVAVSSTTVLKALHRNTVSDVAAASDSAARPRRDWRNALAAMSKDRRERLERVFRDEVEESGVAAEDVESNA